MRIPAAFRSIPFLATVLALAPDAQAQPLGSFTWQLQPFCNRVTMNVRQDGAVYTLDGFDDQCGAGQRAPLVGLATPNPDGSIGFGLNIVATGGKAVSIDARVSLAGLGGTWTDSAGLTGTMAFGANTGGSPRPPAGVGPGDITAVLPGTGLSGGGAAGDVTLSVNPVLVQTRVKDACPAGQAVRAIAQGGGVTCEPVSGGTGDITAVVAGAGLTGGAQSGDAALSVVFAGDGGLTAAARADHEHVTSGTSVGVGPEALSVSTGNFNTAVGSSALRTNSSGSGSVAVGLGALEANTTGTGNVAIGHNAMAANSTGRFNTSIGQGAGGNSSTGERNTLLGRLADLGSGSLSNATAVGADSRVNASNSLVLGSINGVNGATSNVNVGIGTTTPQGRLEIASEGVANELIVRAAFAIPQFIGRASNGTLTAPTGVQAGDRLMSLEGEGFDTAAFRPGAHIELRAAEDWSTAAHGSLIDFFTTPNGAVPQQQRVRIGQDGRVGIGTTAAADLLHVNGDVRVGNCVRNAAGTQIAGTCASDARFKRGVTPFPSLLDRVARLQPVHYFWRAEQFPDRAWSARQTYGLVAQDVEAVLPDLVHTMDDGYKAVDYSKLPLVLLQAVRELKAANDALTEQNNALVRDGRALAERLAILERRLSSDGGPRPE